MINRKDLVLKINIQTSEHTTPEARLLTVYNVGRFKNYQDKWSKSPEGVDETVSSVVKSTI